MIKAWSSFCCLQFPHEHVQYPVNAGVTKNCMTWMNFLVLGSSNSSVLVCHLQSKDFCNWEVHIKRWPEVKHGSTESTFFVQFLFLL